MHSRRGANYFGREPALAINYGAGTPGVGGSILITCNGTAFTSDFLGRGRQPDNMKRKEAEMLIQNPMHVEQICRETKKIRCRAELSTT